ncbi:MAG: hypothetical protein QM776_12940 [Rhodocyclaceae bacterium]
MIAKELTHNLLLLCFTLAFVAQCFIDPSINNLACACIIYSSTVACLLYLRWTRAVDSHPLSSMALLGFNVTSHSGAMLFQSLALTSVSDNLRQPLITFSVLAAAQSGALIMHSVYRWWRQGSVVARPKMERPSFLIRAGLHEVPSIRALWWIGVVGLLGLLMSKIGFLYQLGNGLSFLVVAPFLIPVFRSRVGPDYCSTRLNYTWLAVFAVAIGLVAIAANTRAIMFKGGITIALIMLLELLRSRAEVTARQIWMTAALAVLCWALSYPLSYLAEAMVVARQDRLYSSKLEMLEKTVEVLMDPQKVQSVGKKRVQEARTGYDELYIENALLARFSETKFHDNAMYFGAHMREDDIERLGETTGGFLWAILPQPVLNLFQVGVDKLDLRFSMGDFLAHSVVGHSLGGYATGSIFGQGIALFGAGFAIVYMLLCPLLFLAIDIFALKRNDGWGMASVPGLLAIWTTFQYGITAESFHQMLGGVLRGVVQTIVIYLLVYKAAKFLGQKKVRYKPLNRFDLASTDVGGRQVTLRSE